MRTAIKANPGFAPAYDALAYCLARPGSRQNLDEAHDMALMAVQQDPGNVGYRVRLVEVLLAIGRTDEAIKEANLAVSMAKTSADQSAAAGALEAARKFQESQKKTKEAPKAEPSSDLSSKTRSPEYKDPAPGGQSGVEILSDTMGVDFGPYLKATLQIVKANWHNLLPQSVFPPIRKSGTVTIEFVIVKDGKVVGMKLAGSSADPPLERACWGSIMNSVPFPPLPQEFPGEYLRVRFMYCYNDACNNPNPNVPVWPSKNPADHGSPSD